MSDLLMNLQLPLLMARARVMTMTDVSVALVRVVYKRKIYSENHHICRHLHWKHGEILGQLLSQDFTSN